MHHAKKCIAAFILVMCLASSAHCLDPFKTHENGFGPILKGVQLGNKMSLSDLVVWGIVYWNNWPFTITPHKDDTNEISIEFYGKDQKLESFSILKAEGRYAALKNHTWKLLDLLKEIEKIGFSNRGYFRFLDDMLSRITLDDNMRVIGIWFISLDFAGVLRMTGREFVEKYRGQLIEAYNISDPEPISGDEDHAEWKYSDTSEGWKINISPGGIIITPIVTEE